MLNINNASAFIIKPEAWGNRFKIVREIKAAGFSLQEHGKVRITPQIASKLYPDLARTKNELWQATLQWLVLSGSCFAGVVEGKDEKAAEKFLELCGLEMDPAKCAPESLRYRYGIREAVPLSDGKEYWRNAIHRPRAPEVFRDVLLVCQLLGIVRAF